MNSIILDSWEKWVRAGYPREGLSPMDPIGELCSTVGSLILHVRDQEQELQAARREIAELRSALQKIGYGPLELTEVRDGITITMDLAVAMAECAQEALIHTSSRPTSEAGEGEGEGGAEKGGEV